MIRTRLKMVLTQSEMNRIKISESRSGRICITADVHGMKCYEARRFINTISSILCVQRSSLSSFMDTIAELP